MCFINLNCATMKLIRVDRFWWNFFYRCNMGQRLH